MAETQGLTSRIGSLGHAAKHLVNPYDLFHLEEFPLHTEKPEWAAHAPVQVASTVKRHPHMAGFTETRGSTMKECWQIADNGGYNIFQAPMDAHRNVAIIVRKNLHVLGHEAVVVNNNYIVSVAIDWFGHKLTFHQSHIERHDNETDQTQARAIVDLMRESSRGSGLSFYGFDGNPSFPQKSSKSEPSKTLRNEGMPTVWDTLNHYPTGVGVTTLGHNLADGRVRLRSAVLYDPRGSDHRPAHAVFAIRHK